MKRYYIFAKNLALTKTAKDTYIIFSGNILSAFLGFIYTLLAARALTIADFGVFSAGMNLIYLISSITDLGISGGVVNFVSKLRSEGKDKEADKYVKASFIVRVTSTILVSCFLLMFPGYFAQKLMATSENIVSYLVFMASMGFLFYAYFPYVLQARKEFLKSTFIENSFALIRLVVTFVLFVSGSLTLNLLFFAFGLGSLGPIVLGFMFIGTGFLKIKTDIGVYKKLIFFSGWLGLNRIINSVSGRLDVQMLANMAGAIETGIYSIPSRLSLFIIVLTGSFSTVLAPRFSAFTDKTKEKKYIVKASIALVPIIAGILLWIVIAEPFIVYLFGDKYIESVPVFRLLAFATIPFLTTAPAASAIIYAMKKTIYIGLFAPFQFTTIYILNRIFIPIYGPFGPAITLLIVNTIVAFYVWFIVIRYYWIGKGNS